MKGFCEWCLRGDLQIWEVQMAYRDYELDRDYGNRGPWRSRDDFERDRWYGGYGAGAYGDWDRGWNRTDYGWGGAGAYGPAYWYGGYSGRGEPWYGSGYGNQGFDRGYGGGQWYGRWYPAYRGYGGYGGYGDYGGYGEGYRGATDVMRGGAGVGYEPSRTRAVARGQGQLRSARQSHAGRGPRNYRRSDERIEEDVNESLTRHPGLDASEIEVRVNDGEVTLTGTVDSRLEKRMAEDAAENCPGVRDVHNQLRVSGGATGARAAEREVTRPPQREGRSSSQSGEPRSSSRQTSSASRSK